MKKYPWWTDYQKKLSDNVENFVDGWFPEIEKATWKNEVPWDFIKALKKEGYYGVLVPEKYGGTGELANVTGACIVGEQIARLGANAAAPYGASMFGGCYQLVTHGNEEQKEKYLPRFVNGDGIGAITLTEPFVGSDAAGVQLTAEKEGDHYILNGVKRFISNVGIANIYCSYGKTSNDPKVIKNRGHITGFIVEKGMPGFTVEKINELGAYKGVRNGYLRFDNVEVPAENVIGTEGRGWMVMLYGLNFERTLVAAMTVGGIKEAFRYTYYYTNRRVQFNQPTFFYESNQYRIADIMIGYRMAQLLVYYAAHLFELGEQPVIEANAAKVYVTELAEKAFLDGIMSMGGDSCTRFYPLISGLGDSQVNKIGAGTNDVTKLFLVRYAHMFFADELIMPRRRYDEELGIPVTIYNKGQLKPELKSESTKDRILEVLAEDYRVNPGLYLTKEELEEDLGEKVKNNILLELEEDGLIALYRGSKGSIKLIKATYKGQTTSKPLEYYRWFPEWVKKDEIF
ncbi:MAG: acyl-CoA dehydrogenase family protein [Candidatus Hermodarchaeota archaeon]